MNRTSGGPAAPLPRRILPLLALFAAGCEVQWGGGRLALEDPSPPEPETAEEGEAPPAPLPPGPLLHLVALAPDGRSATIPIASLDTLGLAPLELPSPVDEEYRQRFDSTFLATGTELALIAGGERLGSLVIEGAVGGRPNCLSVATAQAVLPPGALVPAVGFGVPPELAPTAVGRAIASQPARRMVTFGPVLAENLLRAAGVARPFLARRALLEAVASEDTVPSMTATYLINDSLAGTPARGEAASLFFLARFESTRGFVPVWSEVRTYDAEGEKEAFAYLDWLALESGRYDFVRAFDETGERIASRRAPDDWRERLSLAERRFDWSEPPTCPALARLEEALSALR